MLSATENRVAVYRSNADIRLETRPLPRIGAGELLLEVRASGVCGSDVMEWYRRPGAPTVLGHEVAGRVAAVGDGVDGFSVGDRVIATHHVPCLVCRYCLSGRETVCETLRTTRFDPGGFAEWLRVPAVNVERGVLNLPDHVSYDAGSLVEPLGCVLRGQRRAGLGPGDSVLVIGTGVSGSLHIMAARAQGAGRVLASDLRANRREFAARVGADRVLDAAGPVPELLRDELGHGADRVIVCTGARRAIEQALHAVDGGGTVLFFAPMGPAEAYPLAFNAVFWRNDVTLMSSYGAAPRDLSLALELIAAGRIDCEALITHRLPLAEIQTAFEMVVRGDDSMKVIIDPTLDAEAGRRRREEAAEPLSTSG